MSDVFWYFFVIGWLAGCVILLALAEEEELHD